MCGLMLARMSLSSTLTGVQRREMGLCDDASVGGLLGFRMGMILAVFQILGMVLYVMEWLKMLVRQQMATSPSCLR